jgi:hypothetical protein
MTTATQKQRQNHKPETQRDGAATKDKTFAPRRHGDTERKDKWVPSGPVVHLRFRPGQSVNISTLSPQQKDEDTEKQSQEIRFSDKIVASCEDFHD